MSSHQINIINQETMPLSALNFRAYLSRHGLESLDVALASGVRYMMIWRIWEGKPICSALEARVRQGLLRLTGVPYTAPILLREGDEFKSRDSR